MIRTFVDREPELSFLGERWRRTKKAELLIIYGRRRVGKTELILRFIHNKPHMYFLADSAPLAAQLERFIAEAEKALGIEFPRGSNTWAEALATFARAKRCVIAIDEFGYLIERDRAILAEVQRGWDEALSKSSHLLILSGSSVSIMENEVLGVRSPLYGRRTGQWKLQPLKYRDISPMLPNYSGEDLVRTYMTLGGIPAYLEKFDSKLDIWQNVSERILRKGEFLYDEPEFLLRVELREPYSYFPILEAIANGKTKLDQISNHSKIEVRSLPKYLQVLGNLGFVEKVVPVGERKMKTRRYRYSLSDPFFAFWFRYVYPNKGMLEQGLAGTVAEQIAKDFDNYAGIRFEDIALQIILSKAADISFTEYGKWWNGDMEIDLVFLRREGGRYTEGSFFEVKWSTLSARDALNEIRSLEKSVERFPVRLKNYRLGIVAREISDLNQVRENGYLAADLKSVLP